jgi:hypothetical protein
MSGPWQAAGVGVYLEHYNHGNVFRNFRVAGAKVGFSAEWSDPGTGGKPGANNVTIRDGLVDAAGSTLPGNQAGVYLDEGTTGTTVTNVRFANQNWAGISAYKNVNWSFTANDYSKLGPKAVAVRTQHISG